MSIQLDLATAEMSRFEPLLNEKFFARPWEGAIDLASVELELVRAIDYPFMGQEGRRTPFSLFL